MTKPFLSVIIPASNEAKCLPLTLLDVDKHLSAADYSSEIIVVNDGSYDATSDIVKRFIPLMKNLSLVENAENRGKGFAIKEGMLRAKGNLRLFMDADNSTPISYFEKAMPYFKEGYDIVIGSRTMKGAKIESGGIAKKILRKIGNFFVRFLILKDISDANCGFKCFSEEAVNRIFRLAKINQWGFDIEILVLAKLLGFKIKEIPVGWTGRMKSRRKFTRMFSILFDLVKLKIWLRRRKYELGY